MLLRLRPRRHQASLRAAVIRAWLRRCERRRRLVAAVLAALGVLCGHLALRPPAGPAVLVAARDLSPGVLRPGDLRAVPMPAPPDGALRTGATGRVLAAPPCAAASRSPTPASSTAYACRPAWSPPPYASPTPTPCA
ncbi:hypothetical protein ACFSTC_03780 [Nonomuraea ferruginea]